MRKLLKYFLSVICISFVGGMITLFIGNHYDNKQRIEFIKESNEYHKQQNLEIEQREKERLRIWSDLEALVNENHKWKKHYQIQRELLLEELDVSDDESILYFSMIESSKRQLMYQFVKDNYDRNSKERKLIREYEINNPESVRRFERVPERLRYFDAYKKCLPDRLSFIQKQKPEDSALQVFASLAIVLSIICVVCLELNKS